MENTEKPEFELPPLSRLNIPEGEKPDLFEYLVSQPESEVEFPPFTAEEKEKPAPVPEEKVEDASQQPEALAEFIRTRAKAAQITPFAMMLSNNKTVAEVLEKLSKDETFRDIVQIKGEKDSYYYSNKNMTEYFANIAVLVEEKNFTRTLAEMVRRHSKDLALTPIRHFLNYPYFYSKPQLDQISKDAKANPEYEDINDLEIDGLVYFYSTQFIPHGVATSLAEEDLNKRP